MVCELSKVKPADAISGIHITLSASIRKFVILFWLLIKKKVGRIINFGSAAKINSTYKKVKAVADKVGVPMDKREFHCKGEFKGIHKGRPNEADMKAAEDFAIEIVGQTR